MGSEWVFRCGGASRVRNGKTHSDPIFETSGLRVTPHGDRLLR